LEVVVEVLLDPQVVMLLEVVELVAIESQNLQLHLTQQVLYVGQALQEM
tara:strand:- start:345 stop:491 length:147 start_codon:yes stop_codon:yes gene_type:complete